MKKARIVSISVIWIVFLGLILFETPVSSEPTSEAAEPDAKLNASELFFEPIHPGDTKPNETENHESQISIFESEDLTTPYQEITNNETPTKRSSGASSGASLTLSDGSEFDLIDILSARLLFAYLKVFIGSTPPPQPILQMILKPIKALVSDFVKILSLDELQCSVRAKMDFNKWHPVLVLQSVLPGYDQNAIYKILSFLRENQEETSDNPMPWFHLLQILDPKTGCGVPKELWPWLLKNKPNHAPDIKQSDSHEIEEEKYSPFSTKDLLNIPQEPWQININSQYGNLPIDQQWTTNQTSSTPWNINVRPPGLFGWAPNMPSKLTPQIPDLAINILPQPDQSLFGSMYYPNQPDLYNPNLQIPSGLNYPDQSFEVEIQQPGNIQQPWVSNPINLAPPSYEIQMPWAPQQPTQGHPEASNWIPKQPELSVSISSPDDLNNHQKPEIPSFLAPDTFGSNDKPSRPEYQSSIPEFSITRYPQTIYSPQWPSSPWMLGKTPTNFKSPEFSVSPEYFPEFYPNPPAYPSPSGFDLLPGPDVPTKISSMISGIVSPELTDLEPVKGISETPEKPKLFSWFGNLFKPKQPDMDVMIGQPERPHWKPEVFKKPSLVSNIFSPKQPAETDAGFISEKPIIDSMVPDLTLPNIYPTVEVRPENYFGMQYPLNLPEMYSYPQSPDINFPSYESSKRPVSSWLTNIFKPRPTAVEKYPTEGSFGINYIPETPDQSTSQFLTPDFGSMTNYLPGSSSQSSSSSITNIFGPNEPPSKEQLGINYIPKSPDQLTTSQFHFTGSTPTDSPSWLTNTYSPIKSTPEGLYGFPFASESSKPSLFWPLEVRPTDSYQSKESTDVSYPTMVPDRPSGSWLTNIFGSLRPPSSEQFGINYIPESFKESIPPQFWIPEKPIDSYQPAEEIPDISSPLIPDQPTNSLLTNIFGFTQPPSENQVGIIPEFTHKKPSPSQFWIPGVGPMISTQANGDMTDLYPASSPNQGGSSWSTTVYGPTQAPSGDQIGIIPESTYKPSSSQFLIPEVGSMTPSQQNGGITDIYPTLSPNQATSSWLTNVFGPTKPTMSETLGIDYIPGFSSRPTTSPMWIPINNPTDSPKSEGDTLSPEKPTSSWITKIFSPTQQPSEEQVGISYIPETTYTPTLSPFWISGVGPTNIPNIDLTDTTYSTGTPDRPSGSWITETFSPLRPTDEQFGVNFYPTSPERPNWSPFWAPGMSATESFKTEGDMSPLRPAGSWLTNVFGPTQLPSDGQIGINYIPESPQMSTYSPVLRPGVVPTDFPQPENVYSSTVVNPPSGSWLTNIFGPTRQPSNEQLEILNYFPDRPNIPPNYPDSSLTIYTTGGTDLGKIKNPLMFGVDYIPDNMNRPELESSWISGQRPDMFQTDVPGRPSSWFSSIFKPGGIKQEPIDGVSIYPEISDRPEVGLEIKRPGGFWESMFGLKGPSGKIDEELKVSSLGFGGISAIPEPSDADSLKVICLKHPTAPFCGKISTEISSELVSETQLGSIIGDKPPVFILTQLPCNDKKSSVISTSLSEKGKSSIAGVIIPTNSEATEWKVVRMPQGVQLKTLLQYFTRHANQAGVNGNILNGGFSPSSKKRGWFEMQLGNERGSSQTPDWQLRRAKRMIFKNPTKKL